MTLVRYPVVLGPDRSYWQLLADVDRAVRGVLRGDDAFALSRLGPTMVRASQRWASTPMATVAVSYSPVRGVGSAYGSINVHEVSAAITNNNIGAELALAASVFDGQLSCNLLYLEANWDRTTVASVADGFARLLTASE
jgi:hypothetical protein